MTKSRLVLTVALLFVNGTASAREVSRYARKAVATTRRLKLTHGLERRLHGKLGIAILHYEVNGRQTRRIPPLVLTPEDFLDQPVQLDWDDAQRWSNASGGCCSKNGIQS